MKFLKILLYTKAGFFILASIPEDYGYYSGKYSRRDFQTS